MSEREKLTAARQAAREWISINARQIDRLRKPVNWAEVRLVITAMIGNEFDALDMTCAEIGKTLKQYAAPEPWAKEAMAFLEFEIERAEGLARRQESTDSMGRHMRQHLPRAGVALVLLVAPLALGWLLLCRTLGSGRQYSSIAPNDPAHRAAEGGSGGAQS